MYGNGIDDISSKWDNATLALKNYTSVQSAISGLKSTSESKSIDELISSIVDNMKSNSAAWTKTTSTTERDRLSNSNLSLAQQLKSLGVNATRDKTGTWYEGNVELYKKYHDGGSIGKSLLEKEVPIIGKLGEYVLSEQQQKPLVDIINSNKLLTNAVLKSAILTNSILPNISGINNSSNTSNLTQGAFSPKIEVNITATDLNDRELDKVANTVVSKINGTFSQYGIVNSRNARTR